MIEFLKKNIFIIFLSSITLFLGFLTFLTFIDRSFIELSQKNLQYLLILNILLLLALFTQTPQAFRFKELELIAKSKGFLLVSSSPLTRSSYHADEDFAKLQKNKLKFN